MARTPAVTRESVPEREREAFDAFVAARGEVPATGPGSVMLNAPEVAQRALGLAAYLRTETSLLPRIRELAMLLAAPGERLPVHLERPRSAGQARGSARRVGRRPPGQERATRSRRGRDGSNQLRTGVLPDPSRQPGIIRRSGGTFRDQRCHRADNADGLLRHAGVQRQCLWCGAARGPHRRCAAHLATTTEGTPVQQESGTKGLGKLMSKLFSGYSGGYKHLRLV